MQLHRAFGKQVLRDYKMQAAACLVIVAEEGASQHLRLRNLKGFPMGPKYGLLNPIAFLRGI